MNTGYTPYTPSVNRFSDSQTPRLESSSESSAGILVFVGCAVILAVIVGFTAYIMNQFDMFSRRKKGHKKRDSDSDSDGSGSECCDDDDVNDGRGKKKQWCLGKKRDPLPELKPLPSKVDWPTVEVGPLPAIPTVEVKKKLLPDVEWKSPPVVEIKKPIKLPEGPPHLRHGAKRLTLAPLPGVPVLRGELPEEGSRDPVTLDDDEGEDPMTSDATLLEAFSSASGQASQGNQNVGELGVALPEKHVFYAPGRVPNRYKCVGGICIEHPSGPYETYEECSLACGAWGMMAPSQ